VRLVTEEMLPRVAERGLAEYCDVFTEGIAFSLDDSREILLRARELGLGLRLHVDQLTPLGGAELAAELRAASADHLEHVSERGIEALLAAQVIPVLCPVVPLFLRQEREAPARRMIDAGLPVAISTDFNPGSCYLQSMPEVISWAALRYRMSAAECLTAATLNAACSLGRGAEIGSLEPGKRADCSCSTSEPPAPGVRARPQSSALCSSRRNGARTDRLTTLERHRPAGEPIYAAASLL
jgi:imidazolonepropionase